MDYNNNNTSISALYGPKDPGYNPGTGLIALHVIILIVIALAAIIGNTVVIHVVLRDRRLHMPTFYFVVSLAVADILTSVAYVPFYIMSIVSQRWVFNYSMCKAHVFVISMGFNSSLITLGFISFDRFLDIVFPLYYLQMMTTRRMRIMIVMGWIHSVFWAICPWAFNWGEYTLDPNTHTCRPMYSAKDLANELYVGLLVTACFAIPVVAMIYFYIRIFSIVKKHKKEIEQVSCSVASLGSVGSMDSSPYPARKNKLITEHTPTTKYRKPKELRAHNMILIIIVLFLVCWTTYAVVAMVRMVSKDTWGAYWSVNISLTLAILNSAMNPLVYGSRDRRFKRGFKKIFWPVFCKFECMKFLRTSTAA